MQFLEGGSEEVEETDKFKNDEEEPLTTPHVIIANHSDIKQHDPLIQEFIHAQVRFEIY